MSAGKSYFIEIRSPGMEVYPWKMNPDDTIAGTSAFVNGKATPDNLMMYIVEYVTRCCSATMLADQVGVYSMK